MQPPAKPMQILSGIYEPQDLKKLSLEELNKLAGEMREVLIHKINETGGHFGPNLGFIEATIAMHYVFNSPQDKFVFDVSHQCYPHKMLTGRKAHFLNPEKYHEISGFTNPAESEHDQFFIGHTSTAPSLAVGLAKARDLQGQKHNVIAVIGDGSLSGGEALEGLDNAAELDSNLIIVVNDNEICISPNNGGLYKNLTELRHTNGQSKNNFFKAWGLDYIYVEDGNDIKSLIKAFEQVKDCLCPTVVHIHTLKGKGCAQAEADKERFHFIMPHTLDAKPQTPAPSYTSITVDYLLNKRAQDHRLMVLSAATPTAYGITADVRKKLGKGFADVGIAEEHAVAMASGLAKGGAKPILPILSSFVQRTYDQLSQDLALNNNAATLLIFWGAITGGDATHLGLFDIPLISNIPNMVYLAPTNQEEYLAMLDWSVEQTKHSVAIRVPFAPLTHAQGPVDTDYSNLNTFKVTEQGSRVAIIGAGSFYELAKQVKAEIKKELNIDATLINPRFVSGVDKQLLTDLQKDHELVITLEDGAVEGGFGQKVSAFYGGTIIKVLNFGATKEFTDRIPLDELYKRYHLTPELITQDIKNTLN
ncbi:MAG: 1-deoxy-D-xylulose-5-phosphate synthase [Elusimicrobiaceae bacterium]|nr:1-deoxy-D-xylulose-5-phosphate synthase [Elusimicrobiaceae bacterium]